ncbi:DUF4393 domain-containing protein [Paenibacillus xylanilyticus]|uniref:DUF4393 domain-containing protein n=1 Tax=Paenibacillus xylanilyticus TaxID=248903 RepID=UPI003AAFEAD6
MAKGLSIIPTETIQEIYKDLAQPSVQIIGKTIGTAMELAGTVLQFPFRFSNQYLKHIFTKSLENLASRLEKVEESQLVEVRSELAIPILDKLSYINSEELSNLFVNLLASASTLDTCGKAHPGFINIINNLSVDEARIINHMSLNRLDTIPYINYRFSSKVDGGSYIELTSNLTGLEDEIDLIFPDNIPVYLNNLISLGVLIEDDTYYLIDQERLDYLDGKNRDSWDKSELNGDKQEFNQDPKLVKGTYELTLYGKMFIEACTGEQISNQE